MTLKTVPVTGTLYNADGSVAANATVTANLTTVDTDGGVLVPSTVTTTSDTNGVFILNLWPNSRGVNGSQYLVRAQMPGALPGVLLMNLRITVPDSDPAVAIPIATITNRTGPSALSDSKAAVRAAQAYAVQAAQSLTAVGYIYPGDYATAPTTRPDGSAIQNGDRYLNSTDGYSYIYFNGWTSSEKNAKQSALSVAFLYPGTYATAPTTRPDGSAIQNGDRYNNSTDGYEYIRINGAWSSGANQAQAAQTSASQASSSATAAAGSATSATNQATIATSAAATSGAYPNSAASNVPRGLTQASVGAITPGSGGTNGTFNLSWSGGNFSVNPTGTFTVSGGAVTAVTVTGPGLYIGASPTVPTPSFSASTGLTGASVVLTAQFLVASGQGYWVVSSDGGMLNRFKNVSGVATLDGSVGSIPTSANFSALNADPSVVFANVDSSGEWANEVDMLDGTKKIKKASITALSATTSTVGTQTVTGTSTVGALNTSQQQIPTTDLGLLNELIATLDASGEWASMAVNKDGSVRFGKVVAGSMQVTGPLSLNSVSATAASTATLNGAGANAVVARALSKGPLCKTDLVHHVGDGQSNSIGTFPGGTTVLSTTQLYDSLKFNGGVRPMDAGAGGGGTGVRTSFLPLVETVNSGLCETLSTAGAEMIKYLLKTENGLTYDDPTHPQTFRQLFSQDGQGGKMISELMDISLFQRVIDSIAAGVSLANAAGYTYYAPAGSWVQGENDASAGTPRTTYRDALETMRLKIQTQVQAASGQTDPYYLLCAQVASQSAYGVPPTIPMAQYDAGRLYPYIRIFYPMWLSFYTTVDYIHQDQASSRLMGWYYGIFWKRLIVDQKDWHPLEPVEFFKQGNVCRMRFNVPVGQLTRDTTNVPADTADGFRLFDSVGSPVTINSVTQTGPDTLTVVGASSWKEIRCATEATTAGHTGKTQGGPRCNWRDQQGDSLTYNGTAMHNYMVSFGKTF